MTPMRIVLDTNVVLDLFHYTQNDAQPLKPLLADGRLRPLADLATLDELARVVRYPQFGMDEATGQALCAHYRSMVELVEAGTAPPLPRCKDRDDQKFLELAARGAARWLISKDKALLKLRKRKSLGFAIAAPAEAVALLSAPLQPAPLDVLR